VPAAPLTSSLEFSRVLWIAISVLLQTSHSQCWMWTKTVVLGLTLVHPEQAQFTGCSQRPGHLPDWLHLSIRFWTTRASLSCLFIDLTLDRMSSKSIQTTTIKPRDGTLADQFRK